MSFLINASNSITEPVYRVEMGVNPDQIAQIFSSQRGQGKDQPVQSELLQRLRGDIIEVGKPRKWDLQETLSDQQELPSTMQELIKNWRFWLVEMSCAFIPAEEHKITWARFVARLSVPRLSKQPQIYDLYPLEIYDQVEQNRKIGVGLDFKFKVEANLGSYLTEIKYTKLDPKIVAIFGEERRSPTWNFWETHVSDVRGCKSLYLIVQMPRSANSLDIEFGLFVKTKDKKMGIFPVTKKNILSGSERITI